MSMSPVEQANNRDDNNLFRAIIKYRPIGRHQHFRLVALYLAVNDQETPKFSMEDIRTKLSTLYDIDILNEQALAMDDKPESESEEDTTNAIIDFSLPYHEYMQIIEDHGREESESIAESAIDPRSSPTASMRTDDQMPDSEEDQTPSIPAKRGRKPKSSPKSKPRATGNRKSTRKK